MDFQLVILATTFVLTTCNLTPPSCDKVKGFVDGHNFRRSLLATGSLDDQPAASEMKAMIWDDELALKATEWASRNVFKHNPDRTVQSGRFDTVGENIYWFRTTNLDYEFDVNAALDSWWSEHYDYNYGVLQADDFEASAEYEIGHYTQMAWSDSTYVGCGVSETIDEDSKKILVVCDYGPAGNRLGEQPYKSNGTAAGKLICSIGDCARRQYGDFCRVDVHKKYQRFRQKISSFDF